MTKKEEQKKNRQITFNRALSREYMDHLIPNRLAVSHPTNRIQTSKYNLLTFLPKNLFQQFRKIANIFFLFLIILQLIPEYYFVNAVITSTPIIIIVGITALKDAFEDYKRHKNDNLVNNTPATVLFSETVKNYNYNAKSELRRSRFSKTTSKISALRISISALGGSKTNVADSISKRSHAGSIGSQKSSPTPLKPAGGAPGVPEWRQVKWQDVKVGDILKLSSDEYVPADVLILSTSEPDNICFVETKNLDGETNLKLRQGPMETDMFDSPEEFSEFFSCSITTEPPNPGLLKYQCTLSTFSRNEVEKKIPIDVAGMLLRGTVLKNTQWVIGIVIATGKETKLLLNAGSTPSKQSEMEKILNVHVAFNLFFMASLCVMCAIGNSAWTGSNLAYGDKLYGSTSSNPAFEGFIRFWAGLILFQNIVPISLLISIEFAKTIQAYFIHNDLELYYEPIDTPCLPKSWNLAENLGQIEYIFSDKTGTLTRNVMEFKKCSIGGILYEGRTQKKVFQNSPTNLSLDRRSRVSLQIQTGWSDPITPRSPSTKNSVTSLSISQQQPTPSFQDHAGGWFDVELDDELLKDDYQLGGHGENIHQYLSLLATCHTVLIDQKQQSSDTISYKAQSPDEACLVSMAASTGYVFKSRNQANGQNEVVVDINEEPNSFALLQIIEFDSDRKRMSVIVREPKTKKIILYCKGADSVIYERLDKSVSSLLMETTMKHLEAFAQEGLRTLCLAYREISEEQYAEWAKRYNDAMTKMYSDANDRLSSLEKLNCEVERDLLLLGATAIEDKLQEGVPECITTLMRANIKIWVLTGDKMETAINIGFLCGLLKNANSDPARSPDCPDMVLIQIKNAKDKEELKMLFEDAKHKFWNISCDGNLQGKVSALTQQHALIIDGVSLKFAVEDEEMSKSFLQLASKCKTVICCRVSPLQKAKVVSTVKEHIKAVTLAIGDGANDVSMIQAAHVGVGISGEEGLQAAMSADYAIAQFRYLKRLLLVHGRWSYSRNAYMILNFMLKSFESSLIIFWYQFYCGFSSNLLFEFTYTLFYQTIFTIFPTIVFAVFDRDLDDETCLRCPQIYGVEGIPQKLYSHTKYGMYFLESVWQSLICFFIPLYAYGEYSFDSSGHASPDLLASTAMAISTIVTVNACVCQDTHSWTFIHAIFYSLHIIIFPLYFLLYSLPSSSTVYDLWKIGYGRPIFWLSIILAITVSLAPRFLKYAFSRLIKPSDAQILEEMQQMKYPWPSIDDMETNDNNNKMDSPFSNEIPTPRCETAPAHVITFSPKNDQVGTPTGFSFTHTKGVASVIMRGPYKMLASAFSLVSFRKANHNNNNNNSNQRPH